MQTVAISEFKATCLALLERVRKTGVPLLVTRRGVPVAEIRPPGPGERPPSWLGCLAETGEVIGDLVEPVAAAEDWEAMAP